MWLYFEIIVYWLKYLQDSIVTLHKLFIENENLNKNGQQI
jgi:hypothetical protein